MKIKGIIFDMDGVISDTQKLHSSVESGILRRYGIKITPNEITEKYSGVKTREFFDDLLKKQDQEYNLDLLMAEKWSQMEKFASESVDAIDGSVELIKRLSSSGYALAVASSSNLKYVKTVLSVLGVIDYFSFIVGGDMVTQGKPNPECFLLASSKIQIPPESCLVIEDGVSGMQAAKTGGMKCIGLVKDTNKIYPTSNLVTSLSEITQNYIDKI
jgi:HAD superfamily hydrolase (TIGR01509 family)